MGQAEHQAPRIEGYEHIGPIGRGGFSDVYLYQQKMPKREVAIKVLRTDALTDSLRAQFSAEANLMARLSNHTNIASIYAADISDDGEPYLVMEYCSGGSLGDSYRQYPMSVRDVLKLGVRMCGALEAAHRAGIVHRDIKPGNILVTEYGVPVLSDFGISTIDEEFPEATMARAQVYAGDGADVSGTVGLSLPWAAPETLGDPPVSDTRSDRYSLAATLYSLLEGRSPHEIPGGPNGASHLTGRIQSGFIGTMRRPDLPPSLVDVLTKAMAYDRSARFGSSVALGTALQDVQRALGQDVTSLDVPRRQEPAATPPSDTRSRPVNRDDVISLPQGHPTVMPPGDQAGAGGAEAPRRRDLRPPSPWDEPGPDSVPPPPPTHTSGGGAAAPGSVPPPPPPTHTSGGGTPGPAPVPPPPTHTSGGGTSARSSLPPPPPPTHTSGGGTTARSSVPPTPPPQHGAGAPVGQSPMPPPPPHSTPLGGGQHSAPPPPPSSSATPPPPPSMATSGGQRPQPGPPTGGTGQGHGGSRRRIVIISSAAALVVVLLIGGLWWFNRPPTFEGPAIDHLEVMRTGGGIYQVDIPEGLNDPNTIETTVVTEGNQAPIEEGQSLEIAVGHNSWLPGYPVELDPAAAERDSDTTFIDAEELADVLGTEVVDLPAGSVLLVAVPKGYFANQAPELDITYTNSQLAAIMVVDAF